MKATLVEFGLIEIDGRRFDRDVVVEGGRVGRRDKKASKPLRDRYGHTPLSLLEPIPWKCRRLVVGTGANGALPIDDAVFEEAARRGVELVALPTEEACELLSIAEADIATTNAILHVTC
ncbi:MAG TPA: MTH938/NDUFAF3 family protein [Patescibacteria group bacterium]|nr:MTH938/NDUFAF3 family protein [Patescibacteria group bacterium]